MSQIDDQIWIGSHADVSNQVFMEERRINVIVCCAEEFKTGPGFTLIPGDQKYVRYYFPIVDNIADDATETHFKEAAARINEHVVKGDRIMVHCFAGMSRSVSAVMTYYMLYRKWNYDIILSHIKVRRPIAGPYAGYLPILKRISEEKLVGVSFIIRVRNEEEYLKKSLESLRGLTIPHECVIVLHNCTDRSKEIVIDAIGKGQPIRMFETDQDLSKAGYETLITPASYPQSLPSFYNVCFSKGRYKWSFKWDADMTASPELIEFLNTKLVLDEPRPVKYNIPCQMTETIINCESYLFNCLTGYSKYIFWEVPNFAEGCEQRTIEPRIHTIPPTVLKEYWVKSPWFVNKDPVLEKKYAHLLMICGLETPGASRAQCKDCDVLFFRVKDNELKLNRYGIDLYG